SSVCGLFVERAGDTGGDTAGCLMEAPGEVRRLARDIAPACVTPFAVAVEVVLPDALHMGGSGPSQGGEGGRVAHALGRELPGVAESVGVFAQAEMGQFLPS